MVAGRYFNPAGRNISGKLSGVLNDLSNRKSQAQNRQINDTKMGMLDEDRSKKALVEDFAQIGSLLDADDVGQAIAVAESRIKAGEQLGKDMSHTYDLLNRLRSDPESAKRGIAAVLEKAKGAGYWDNSLGKPAGTREFEDLTRIVQNPDKHPPEVVRAARISLGLDPRAGTTSADERKALDPELGAAVVQQEAAEAGAKEDARGASQMAWKPKLEADIAKARTIATEQGKKFTEVEAMKAAMPSLMGTVAALRDLAPIATYTVGGKVFDRLVKELGFEATEGATARAKYISIVANQVLPLLKQTFGAAFTKDEGNELKATMGDPDASPAEKIAQLEAFIEQKERNILAGEAEIEAAEGGIKTQPQSSEAVNWSDLK